MTVGGEIIGFVEDGVDGAVGREEPPRGDSAKMPPTILSEKPSVSLLRYLARGVTFNLLL